MQPLAHELNPIILLFKLLICLDHSNVWFFVPLGREASGFWLVLRLWKLDHVSAATRFLQNGPPVQRRLIIEHAWALSVTLCDVVVVNIGCRQILILLIMILLSATKTV